MWVSAKLRRVAAAVAVVAMFSASAASPAYSQTSQLGDVPADAYFTTPVTELAAAGVFSGTLCDDGFCPGDPIDRKTMAVWVVRLLDGQDPPAVAQSRFNDVDVSSFYAPFIERMAELGVTTGCDGGSGYCPDGTVSRAHMAVFLTRAYDLAEGPDPGFDDVDPDAWYFSQVAALAASGVTQGCGTGSGFCPEQSTERAHMATFLWRAEQRGEPEPEGSAPLAAPSAGEIISAGTYHSCGVRADGTITCWGSNTHIVSHIDHAGSFGSVYDGKLEAPTGRFLSVSAGDAHSCAVRVDQTVVCWGNNPFGQTDAPAGQFTMVSAGASHSCGVRIDQTVACWGSQDLYILEGDDEEPVRFEDTSVVAPSGQFTMVVTGVRVSCGLRTDQTVICWGDESLAQSDPPAGRFTTVDARFRACGVLTDQTVACWGTLSAPRPTPAGHFSTVSVGSSHRCGVRTDQTVTCWGLDTYWDVPTESVVEDNKTQAPAGHFIAVSAGVSHSCGVRTDRTAVCWGANEHFNPESDGFITDGKADAPAGHFGPS